MNSTGTTQAANPLDGITAAIESAIQQAREQADAIINDARAEAEQIVADARAEAEQIVADARAEAEQIIADAGAQANTRARDDMERASLAIQEHAAALHTIALGLTEHETTPHDNTDAASGGADDDSANSSASNTDSSIANENTDDSNAGAIPPAPTATPTAAANDIAPTNTSRATGTPHTARRADGTTRKLAPWEQPQDEPAPEPEETPTIDTTEGNNPERTSAEQDATTPPTWDAPLIIDAPLQL